MDTAIACVTTPLRWPQLQLPPSSNEGWTLSPCGRSLLVAYCIIALLFLTLCCRTCCCFQRPRLQQPTAPQVTTRRIVYEGFARRT